MISCGELTCTLGFAEVDVRLPHSIERVLKTIERKLGSWHVICRVGRIPQRRAGRGAVSKHGAFLTVFMTNSDPRS